MCHALPCPATPGASLTPEATLLSQRNSGAWCASSQKKSGHRERLSVPGEDPTLRSSLVACRLTHQSRRPSLETLRADSHASESPLIAGGGEWYPHRSALKPKVLLTSRLVVCVLKQADRASYICEIHTWAPAVKRRSCKSLAPETGPARLAHFATYRSCTHFVSSCQSAAPAGAWPMAPSTSWTGHSLSSPGNVQLTIPVSL